MGGVVVKNNDHQLDDLVGSGLEMSQNLMSALAQKATELLLERKKNLPTMQAWDGEYREELEAQLSEPPPEKGSDPLDVVERIAREVLPITARHDHPRFFGFIPSSPTWPGILADYLASGFNINQATWLSASGPTQIELVVMEWICSWLGYPKGSSGLFTSGGSSANLICLVAARDSLGYPKHPTVYLSEQTHVSINRAALICGIRSQNIRTIPTDEIFRIDMEALIEAVSKDREKGLNPIAVIANAGTTSTGSIDPLDAIADYCEDNGVWMHVDAAFGGFAIVTERGKKLLRGIERADSICLDAHKWLFQPYEAGCVVVKDVATLENAFSIRHDVLQDTVWGKDYPNFSDRGLQLSRSARALKVWMSIQMFGVEAFRNAILNGMRVADRAAEKIMKSSVLELLSHESLAIVCFRVNPQDSEFDEQMLKDVNHAVLVRIFWEEAAFMSSTNLRGKYSLRMCIINHTTTLKDVSETLDTIEKIGQEVIEQKIRFK